MTDGGEDYRRAEAASGARGAQVGVLFSGEADDESCRVRAGDGIPGNGVLKNESVIEQQIDERGGIAPGLTESVRPELKHNRQPE